MTTTTMLTIENVHQGLRIICKQHPEWGVSTLTRDRNGWVRRSPSGEAMLDEGEFHFWQLAGDADPEDRAVQSRQTAMFGCTKAALQEFVADQVGEGKTFATRVKAAFSLLSDAQEELEMGLVEQARRTINRAKWLIDERN